MGEGYNGWTNRETWAVALHVNNDQGWQEQIHELIRDARILPTSVSYIADLIERNVTAIVDPLAYIEEFGDILLSEWVKGPGMAARDIGDLDKVNWHELAESFIRDVRESE